MAKYINREVNIKVNNSGSELKEKYQFMSNN